jgi:hypothetical protein
MGKAGIDYRTARVIRTEMYNAFREADILAGAGNPGATGEYDWILSPTRESWPCDCPDRAAGSPYSRSAIEDLNASAHPNCGCMTVPRLKKHDDFMQELFDYVDGKDTPGGNGISQWASENGY